MGTALTGLEIRDTYDALLKISDNGPLDGTLQTVTDGLGNDSSLALSTAGASVTGTFAVSGAATFDTTTLVVDATNNRVGVGTASPSVALHTSGVIRSANAGNTVYTEVQNDGLYATATDLYLLAPATKFVSFYAGGAESMRITSAGNVGIGTTTSTYDSGKIGSTHRFLSVQAGAGLYAVGTLAGNQSGNGDRLGYLTFVNDNNSASYKYSAWIGSEVEGATANQQGGRLIFSTTADASAAGPIEHLRITSAGLVGIGTSSPKGKVDVIHGNTDPVGLQDVAIDALRIGRSGGGVTAIRSAQYDSIGQPAAGDIQFLNLFFNGSTYNYYERMRITAAGNVGIGTASPARKVQIDGGSITSDTPTLRISSTDGSGTNKFGIEFFSNSGADVRGKLLADNNGRVYLDDNGGGGVVLQSNGGTGNVGIGTASPAARLHIFGNVGDMLRLDRDNTGAVGNQIAFRHSNAGTLTETAAINAVSTANADTGSLVFYTKPTGGSVAERLRITSAGNVGIGTTSPNIGGYVAGNTILTMAPSGSDKFSVVQLSGNRGFGGNQNGNIDFINSEGTATITSRISGINGANALDGQIAFETRTSAGSLTERLRITNNGLTFNGDTAAANALDDYEEGTFTPSVAFGGGSTGITYFDRVANYTKIGRQVYVQMYVALTNKGTDTGTATITGLPFTVSSTNRGSVGAIALDFADITFTGQMNGQAGQSATQITLTNTTEAGSRTVMTNANFTDASQFWLNITYNV